MSRLKKILTTTVAVCISSMYFNVVPTLATAEDNYSLQNSGFELPAISKTYDQPLASNVPDWNTTAYGQKIELLTANNGVYITGKRLAPKVGTQAAELNADEQSSLYQSIKTTPGSFVKWGISHHGRNGYDTMLLVIGPKQSVDPIKPTKNGYDQFMKMGQYISKHSALSSLLPTGSGASEEIILYTPKFAKNGGFSKDTSFTTYRTESNTEKWHIWFIRSNNDGWYDYGTNVTSDTSKLGYNNIYEVPEGQTDTTFAFTAYESAPKSDGKVDLTYGNIIDDINFGLLYNVSIHTLTGGSGSVEADNAPSISASYDGTNFAKDKYKSDSVVTLTVTPDDAADYIFAGATINGTLYNYTDFTANEANTVYTKDITVDEAKHISLAFARKGHISYDPNGGTYKEITGITDKEYSYYTNGITESEIPSHDSAAFMEWTLFTNDGVHSGTKIPANHRVEYSADDSGKPILEISWTDSNDVPNSVTLSATKEDGVMLVANYDYKHEAVALTEGGSVDITNSTTVKSVSGHNKHRITAGEEGDIITVSANVEEGYQFDGWFENAKSRESSEAISKALEYSYVVTGNSVIYAKFSTKVEEEIKEDVKPEEEEEEEEEEVIPPYTVPVFDNSYAYIYGYDNTTMAPDDNALRCEVAAMLHRLVKQNNKLSGFVYDEGAPAKFEDIDGKWYRSAIEYLISKNAIDTSTEYCYAESDIKRGETFKLVCLGLGFTKDSTLTYEQYGKILLDAGVIEGYDDGSLGLNDSITRAQFCKMYNVIIGRDNASLVTADGQEITAMTYGFEDLRPGKWYYEDMLRATSAYDEDGYVDIAKRAIRNNLDDYKE